MTARRLRAWARLVAHRPARWTGRGLWAWSLIVLVLSACQPVRAALPSQSLVAAEDLTPVATAVNPPVVYTVSAPVEQPSFSLATPTLPRATEDTLTTAGSAAATGSEQTDPVPSPVSSPTPRPTFTPPALPFTSLEEHYWLRRPVADGGTVWTNKTYPYGHTRGGMLRTHHGVEFDVAAGTELLAVASGTVRVAGTDSDVAYGPHPDFYGKLLVLELDTRFKGQPVYVLYGHLSELLVTVGQHVQVQEVVALSGATGVADGAHLHLEIRVGENSYDHTRNPLLWLYPFPDRGAVAGRVTWPGGALAQEVPITLRRVDAPSPYAATTTYADDRVNADEAWNENFAFDDVSAGFYELIVDTAEGKIKETLWVFPYRTSFIEIALDAGQVQAAGD